MKSVDRWIAGAALAVTALPPLADVASGGVTAAVRYSGADAFYYHTVARNLARLGRATYDGTLPTNGFHPLWQLTLAFVYRVSHLLGADDASYVVISVLLSIALVTVAVAFICAAFLRARGRVPLLIAFLPCGVYAALMAPVWYKVIDQLQLRNTIEGPEPLYGTLWSLMNGMESPLALALFAALAWRFSQRDRRSPLVDAAWLAALTLARLDLVFVAAPLLAYVVVSALRSGRTRAAEEAIALYGAAIGAYLLINRVYAGVFMPVSGASKSSFPLLATSNFSNLDTALKDWLVDLSAYGLTWRFAQTLVPALFVVLCAPLLMLRARWLGGIRIRFSHADAMDRFLAVSGAGVLALALYDFCFMRIWGEGHWYFPVSVPWITLAVASALDRVATRRLIPTYAGLALIVAASLVVFLRLHRRTAYHVEQALVLEHASEIRSHFREKPRVVEHDDGFIAFVTDFPAIASSGFSADREAAAAIADGRLYPLAVERGFSNIALFSYNPDDFSRLNAEQIAAAGKRIVGDKFTVSLSYALPYSRFAILSFKPK